MKRGLSGIVFWIGLIVLIIDLLSYARSIKIYFTTLGIILLPASIILILVGYLMKE